MTTKLPRKPLPDDVPKLKAMIGRLTRREAELKIQVQALTGENDNLKRRLAEIEAHKGAN